MPGRAPWPCRASLKTDRRRKALQLVGDRLEGGGEIGADRAQHGTAATAIRAAIKPYSIAVAPSSFLKSLMRVANIPGPPLAADPCTMPSISCQTLKPRRLCIP